MHLVHMAGSVDQIVGGLAPDWGPFGALGAKARIIVEVCMAGALLVCFVVAIWSVTRMRFAASSMGNYDSADHREAKGRLLGALVGVFLIGSLGALFTIVYGFAV